MAHSGEPTGEAWNLAFLRVEDYLRAHRLFDRRQQVRLIERVLARAAELHRAAPEKEPAAVAAGVAEAMMDDWFAQILEEDGVPHARVAVDGRLALLICDGAVRWPDAFLEDPARLPAEFVQAMREAAILAGPDLEISSMVPRPIDLGPITSAAGETLERFERWPVLRTALLWIVFAGALTVIFRLTR